MTTNKLCKFVTLQFLFTNLTFEILSAAVAFFGYIPYATRCHHSKQFFKVTRKFVELRRGIVQSKLHDVILDPHRSCLSTDILVIVLD